MMKQKLKAAAYLRVSTKDQNEDTQYPDIRQQAEKDNADLIEKYIFKDKISGLKDKSERLGLNELLELTNRDIDIVYIWEASRLSRDPLYFDELINIFKRKRINICFLKPMCLYLFDRDTKTEDITTSIALSIFSKFALFEIQQKTQRTQRGKKEAIIARNESYTSKPPYGYKKKGKYLIINDIDILSDVEEFKTEKDIIHSIFDMYTSGKTIRQIQLTLNQYQIPTRNKTFLKKDNLHINSTVDILKENIQWGRRSIHCILINTVYCGYKDVNINIKLGKDEENKDIIKTETNRINTPAIISEEVFMSAQKQMGDNKIIADKSYKNQFLLRGVLKCGCCSKYYLGSGSKGKNYYICADKTHKRSNTFINCKNINLNTENIDSVIWNIVKEGYASLKNSRDIEQKKESIDFSISNLNKEIEYKRSYISDINKELDKLAKRIALVDDVVFKQLVNEIAQRKRLIDSVEDEILTCQDKIGIEKTKLKSLDKIKSNELVIEQINNSFNLRKEAIKEFVEYIDVFKAKKVAILEIRFVTGFSHYVAYDSLSVKYIIFSTMFYSFDKNKSIMREISFDGKIRYSKSVYVQNLFNEFKDRVVAIS